MTRDTFHFISPNKNPMQVIDLFRRFYGPSMNAYDAADKNGKVAELHAQLVELAESQNTVNHGTTSIPATFLRVTISL
jgi:hypothetical protein